MNADSILKEIDHIEFLNIVPTVEMELLQMLNHPATTIMDVAGKIKLDQSVVSYVLKHCNSPLYGLRKEVSSISQAVSLLGFSKVRSLLMTLLMSKIYHRSHSEPILAYFWEHAVIVAVFAKQLATALNLNKERAYVAGLLHDIGKLALYMARPAEYGRVFDTVMNSDRDFWVEENRVFSITHVETGYFLMEKWRLSDFLRQALLYHHEFFLYSGEDRLVALVAFANQLVHHVMEKRLVDLDVFMRRFNMNEAGLQSVVEEAVQLSALYRTMI